MIAVVFPGQGSQKPGMGQELYDQFQSSKAVFDRVGSAIGVDVARLCFESDEDTLRSTQNAQIALYTCGLAAHAALGELADVSLFAGHSVGEYAAVVASGALSIEQGAKLVWRRGELMREAPKGTMAAVLGLEAVALTEICASVDGVVVVANDNCPGQLVISGSEDAVAAAGALAAERGAKRVLPLNVSGAFHSPLMVDAARSMGESLRAAEWGIQAKPVIANVTASPVTDASRWPDLLERQLSSSVRWTESVQAMIRAGVIKFVECGSGEVLTGLLRRIDKSVEGVAVTDAASASQLVEGVSA